MSDRIRVRYAPSPTGHLHIGGVRTALFNFLFAKHHGGDFILRLEDTDLERNIPGAEQEILEGFRWLGFDWAEGPDVGGPYGPYRCTERLDIYRAHLNQLRAQGKVYPCFCTSEDLEAERQRMMAQGLVPRYAGHCRALSAHEREEKLAQGVPHHWRFVVPAEDEVHIDDLVRGTVSFPLDELGDFVVVKSNGMPTYNFQVVVDDILMDITHVIRGEEHLSNTPRQLLIYRALDVQPPQFGHLPQVLDETRKKLSKRDPNVLPVLSYRDRGYVPEAIVNFLALLGWSPGGEEEIMGMESLISRFTLERVNRSGAVFDVNKLRWMAAQYVKALPQGRLVGMVEDQLAKHTVSLPEGRDRAWLTALVTLFQEHMVSAADFLPLSEGFFRASVDYSEEALQVLRQPDSQRVLVAFREDCKGEIDGEWNADNSRARFKRVQKDIGVKGRALFMPVRAALTGHVHGPDLQMTIASLSKEWVIERIDTALAKVLSEEYETD